MNYRKVVLTFTPALFIYVLYAPLTLSAEYLIDAELSPTLKYDDNVLLREDEDGSFFTVISPTLLLSRQTENTSFGIETGYKVERYTSLSDLDRQDPFAFFNGSVNTEKSTFGIRGGYSERAQRSIAEEDAGQFGSDSTVKTTELAPSFKYQISDKDFVYTDLSYQDREYDSADSGVGQINSLADNETIGLTAGWERIFSERLTAGMALSYVTYEADADNFQSDYDSYSAFLTATYRMTERWSLTGRGGYTRLESERSIMQGPVLDDTTAGTQFGVVASYVGDYNLYSIEVARELNPSGEGVINEQDLIAFIWQRDISERLTAKLNASYQMTESAADFDNIDREYMVFSPSLSWLLRENLALDFGYQYRKVDGDTTAKADSNMVFMTLNYDWDGIRFSR